MTIDPAGKFFTAIEHLPQNYPIACKTTVIVGIALAMLSFAKNFYLLATVGFLHPIKFMLLDFNPYFLLFFILAGAFINISRENSEVFSFADESC